VSWENGSQQYGDLGILMYFLFIEPIQVILICEKYIFCKRDLFLYKKGMRRGRGCF
jgi:hypothetical protein